MRTSRRGFTLLELLIAFTIIGLLTSALAFAYSASADLDTKVRAGRESAAAQDAFERRLTSLVEHAYLSTDAADTTTYFVAVDAGGGSDRITFTTLGERVPQAVIDSEDDFETLNSRYGPQGGIGEISLGTTAVGSAPIPNGLFLREQRPSDGDPDQGGYESVFNSEIEKATFEFWDGQQWVPEWDTRQQTERRLPAAIRMTYRFNGDRDDRTYIVRIPGSDITAENPLTQTSGAAQ